MKREKLPLRKTSIVIRWVETEAAKWTAGKRLRVALANDNGGEWWECESRRSVADLERKFWEGSMASVLHRAVGGLLGDHKATRQPTGKCLIYVQLKAEDADVRMCLAEAGVRMLKPIRFAEISAY